MKTVTHTKLLSQHTHLHRSIETQLSLVKMQQQREARSCLLKISQSVRFLALQGLALRGHESDGGNFVQLLKLRAEDDEVLKRWLSKPCNHYTSPEVQNEILNIMGNSVVRKISKEIHEVSPLMYFIIIDGVHDLSGSEQKAIRLRYVDRDLLPHEDFVGLSQVSSTTGKELAWMATDVLLRLNLPL